MTNSKSDRTSSPHHNAISDIPDIFLNCFENVSYGNDGCASLIRKIDNETFIYLLIDYPDIADREEETDTRFSVTIIDGNADNGDYDVGDGENAYTGNSLESVVITIENFIEIDKSVIEECEKWGSC